MISLKHTLQLTLTPSLLHLPFFLKTNLHTAPNDPLILTLSTNHQVHTVINGTCHIFGLDEDVPIEFQTVDGYVSDY